MRDVVPVRLSDAERAQIARASERRKVSLSGFIREAALQASAIVEGKARVKEEAPEPAGERLIVIDPEPDGHWVDGELVSR